MALIRINATGPRPELHGIKRPLLPVLKRASRSRGPILIMIHGYRFLPEDPDHCPHTHILGAPDVERPGVPSWPKRLGVTRRGLGVAFGWNARGSLRDALNSARDASRALASLITTLRQLSPGRPVHLIAHSMGAPVALGAMARLSGGDIGRVLLLNAAAFQGETQEALKTQAGRHSELFNITSRENAVFDRLYTHALRRRDKLLGEGLSAPNALTLRLDDAHTLAQLTATGFDIAPPLRRHCHWSTYLRPGVFPFYRALFHHPNRYPLAYLQNLLIAQDTHAAPKQYRRLRLTLRTSQ
ncbi:alpha/beta fold hydrolase [Shimia sp.]|uniref:alpha/beta fold hydrolase n=1 Tax=Shimia sp. TaxID=1954381 RepID=UPI0032979F81